VEPSKALTVKALPLKRKKAFIPLTEKLYQSFVHTFKILKINIGGQNEKEA